MFCLSFLTLLLVSGRWYVEEITKGGIVRDNPQSYPAGIIGRDSLLSRWT